jgi:cysteine desulfurase
MIYFDNGATTSPYPEVVESMKEVLSSFYGNPSSLHHLGVKAEKLLSGSRELAAKYLEVDASEIIFTSGATESNNTAIKGVAFQYQNRGKHLITSAVEHPAVLDVCNQLKEFGFEITVLPVDENGVVRLEEVKKAIRNDTILVSIMYVNNEVGSIQPIAEIGKILKDYPKILFHVDAVQGFGKLDVSPNRWDIDLLSLSAHKFHGPKGTGLLYVRKGVKLSPLMAGGGQEKGLRPGTENVAGIVGMVKAMRMIKEKREMDPGYLFRLRKKLWEGLRQIPECVINSPENGSPHILNVSFPGLKSEVILHTLEDKKIYVSTKSACSSKLDRPSRILLAMGAEEQVARSAIRISLSDLNTMDEVEFFLQIVSEKIPTLKTMLNI